MRNHIRRREFITLLGGSMAAWPLAAGAQQPGKVWRIGVLSANSPQYSSDNNAALVQGMHDLGYVEGKDFIIEARFADGDYARFPGLAAELLRLNVDILIAGPTRAVLALQEATRTIPIVIVATTDPVGNSIVASLARPGGNTTGQAGSNDDTAPKQLELLAAFVPTQSRIGVLGNPENPAYASVLKSAQEAARKAGLLLMTVEARNQQDIDNAFATFSKARVQAVMVAADPVFGEHRQRLAQLALWHRLPTMSSQREFAAAGGLMSYGESQTDFYRRTAIFVHKLMRGAKPADLPVEQPTRFHLTINRKTADALGVTIPALLYVFAEEVIE
jgi:ABC-type uncharacterized transport system substrate-binding protein